MSLAILLLLTLGAAPLAAQIDVFPQPKPVRFTGAAIPTFAPLDDAGGESSFELPPATHGLVCGGALLSSEGVDLDAFAGDVVTFSGSVFLDFTPARVLVTGVEPAAAVLAADAPFLLGCPLTLSVTPGGAQQVWIFVATDVSFTPVGQRGTWQLAGPFLALVNGALSTSLEGFSIDLVVPDEPALIGVPLALQAANRPLAGGALQLSNAICGLLNESTQPCFAP